MKIRTIMCLLLAALLSFGGAAAAVEAETAFEDRSFVTAEDASADWQADYPAAEQKRATAPFLRMNGQTFTEDGSVEGATFSFGESEITLALNGYSQTDCAVSGTSAYGIYSNMPLFITVYGTNNIEVAPQDGSISMLAGIYSTGDVMLMQYDSTSNLTVSVDGSAYADSRAYGICAAGKLEMRMLNCTIEAKGDANGCGISAQGGMSQTNGSLTIEAMQTGTPTESKTSYGVLAGSLSMDSVESKLTVSGDTAYGYAVAGTSASIVNGTETGTSITAKNYAWHHYAVASNGTVSFLMENNDIEATVTGGTANTLTKYSGGIYSGGTATMRNNRYSISVLGYNAAGVLATGNVTVTDSTLRVRSEGTVSNVACALYSSAGDAAIGEQSALFAELSSYGAAYGIRAAANIRMEDSAANLHCSGLRDDSHAAAMLINTGAEAGEGNIVLDGSELWADVNGANCFAIAARNKWSLNDSTVKTYGTETDAETPYTKENINCGYAALLYSEGTAEASNSEILIKAVSEDENNCGAIVAFEGFSATEATKLEIGLEVEHNAIGIFTDQDGMVSLTDSSADIALKSKLGSAIQSGGTFLAENSSIGIHMVGTANDGILYGIHHENRQASFTADTTAEIGVYTAYTASTVRAVSGANLHGENSTLTLTVEAPKSDNAAVADLSGDVKLTDSEISMRSVASEGNCQALAAKTVTLQTNGTVCTFEATGSGYAVRAEETLDIGNAVIREPVNGRIHSDTYSKFIANADGTAARRAVIGGLMGDVDLDGDVDAADAALILRAVVAIETLTKQQTANADVNGDGTVNAGDAAAVLRQVVGIAA